MAAPRAILAVVESMSDVVPYQSGDARGRGDRMFSVRKIRREYQGLSASFSMPGDDIAKSLFLNGPKNSGANINILTRMSGDACSVSPLGSYAPDSRLTDVPRALGIAPMSINMTDNVQ